MTYSSPPQDEQSAGAEGDGKDTFDSDKLELALKLATIESMRADTSYKIAQAADLTKSKQGTWAITAPIATTIIVAIMGLFSNAYVTYENSKDRRELELLRGKTTLIVEAVKTGSNDPSVAKKNLQFFLDAGLLQDPDGKIASLLSQGKAPVLQAQPAAPAALPQPPLPATAKVSIDRDNQHYALIASVPALDVHKICTYSAGHFAANRL